MYMCSYVCRYIIYAHTFLRNTACACYGYLRLLGQSAIETGPKNVCFMCFQCVRACRVSRCRIECRTPDRFWASSLVKQPLVDRNASERLVENAAEQAGYTGRCSRSHFLHQLVGVVVQELIDGLTCGCEDRLDFWCVTTLLSYSLTEHVLVVDVVLHLEAGILHREIDNHLLDFHVLDAIPIDRLAVHLGNGADVGCTCTSN